MLHSVFQIVFLLNVPSELFSVWGKVGRGRGGIWMQSAPPEEGAVIFKHALPVHRISGSPEISII